MTTASKQLKDMKGKLEILESKLNSVEGLVAALQEEAKNQKVEILEQIAVIAELKQQLKSRAAIEQSKQSIKLTEEEISHLVKGTLSRVMAEHHQIGKRKLNVRVTGIPEGETGDLKHHVAQSILQELKLVVHFSDAYRVGKT